MIDRRGHVADVRSKLKSFPVVGIVGPRQVGKTTLAAQVAKGIKGRIHRFDLEDSRDRDRLADPMAALEPLRGTVILDEVQRLPDLFPTLRVLADRRGRPARFLILGSASPGLLRQSSESLAGRIVYHELTGFSLVEVGSKNSDELWLRGGFPRAYLARGPSLSLEWRRELMRSFFERDLTLLGSPAAPETMRRFWTMLAHVHAQVLNTSDLARSFGVSDKTVRGYLDFLASTYMVRLLRPWHENLGKRQVKSPKVYFRDTGLLHRLTGTQTLRDLLNHPRCGASWEGFALEEVIRLLSATEDESFFWAVHSGAQLDLLIVRGRKRIGFEFKRSPSPGLTPSMRTALEDLRLSRLVVVHPGSNRYPLGKRAEALPLKDLLKAF